MLSLLFMQNGIPWLILAFAGILIFIVLGLVLDLRFFVLALIWVFLVIPLLVAFLYFFYGMQPLTAFNTIPHKILFDSSELRIQIIPYEEEKDTYEEEEIQTGNHVKDYVVFNNELKEIKSGGNYVILFFKNKGWLWLPLYAFDTYDTYKTIIGNFNPVFNEA